jgi:hypothetical protein
MSMHQLIWADNHSPCTDEKILISFKGQGLAAHIHALDEKSMYEEGHHMAWITMGTLSYNACPEAVL